VSEETCLSGSAGDKQHGLWLIVPALTLALPAVLLIGSLLVSPALWRVAAPPADAQTVILLAAAPAADLAIVVDTPIPEPPAPPPLALVTEPTPAPNVAPTLVHGPLATPTPRESWMGPQAFTFVALGVDLRKENEIPRTDTIMIGRVDLREPRVSLISIPRDLLVEIPGYGKDRINTAYVYGEQFKGRAAASGCSSAPSRRASASKSIISGWSIFSVSAPPSTRSAGSRSTFHGRSSIRTIPPMTTAPG
jgi:hypothetical protein